MLSQSYNQGELKELKLNIDKEVVESLATMSKNSGLSVEDIVVIALQRFRACHLDYEDKVPRLE